MSTAQSFMPDGTIFRCKKCKTVFPDATARHCPNERGCTYEGVPDALFKSECPECGAYAWAKVDMIGKEVECPECKNSILVKDRTVKQDPASDRGVGLDSPQAGPIAGAVILVLGSIGLFVAWLLGWM